MAATNHALLGPSSSKRWINCTPSARLTETYEDSESVFAAEGTDAHALCEYKLRKALGVESEPMPELQFYDKEMEESANAYVSYIMELVEEAKKNCKDPIVLIEQYLNFEKYVPEAFGTGDCLVAGDKTLYVVDFKYGRGVLVDAKENTQMMLYALGALELFDCIYDIDKVHMTIYQPRLSNISTYEISKEELYKWANDVLIPKAQMAYKGEGEYHCGEWCQFCKAKTTCRERANFNLALATGDFAKPPLLTDEEVENVLERIDTLVTWATDIKDYAFNEALKGKKWKGWKLVAGRSNRKYADETAVATAVQAIGIDPFEKKLLTITELQKKMGKAKFEEIVGKYIIKPEGKPTLVVETDKRPEITVNSAENDFKNIDNTED